MINMIAQDQKATCRCARQLDCKNQLLLVKKMFVLAKLMMRESLQDR